MPTNSIMVVTYQLTVPADVFRIRAEKAAEQIVLAPGLRWKIWGLDLKEGRGTSLYLFDSQEAATAFAEGPAIAALRDDPSTIQVTVRVAPVEEHLSKLTFGDAPLGLAVDAGGHKTRVHSRAVPKTVNAVPARS